MKVIITKDFKNWKQNQIIEVNDGYGKNFLIPQGIALPYNQLNQSLLAKKIALQKQAEDQLATRAKQVKEQISVLNLVFYVKSHKGILHNSISKKQVVEELKKHNIIIKHHQIENFKISDLGLFSVKINLLKDINALLKLEVKDGN